jgi:hypothetical protein
MSGVMLVFAYPSIHYYLITADLKRRRKAVQSSDIYNPDVRMDSIYVTQDTVSTSDDTSVKDVELMQKNPLAASKEASSCN